MRASSWSGWASLALGLWVLAACGQGAVFLTIEAVGPEGALRIPDDVDRVVVRVTDDEGMEVLLEKEYPLTEEQRFPLTLGLEPGPKTGERIRVEVMAFKGEELVGDAAAVVPITRQQEASATLRIVKS
ncbi:hypothetical protein [Hyalangium sp.]|uniref:hypothetical protein n=1 Tax=Hyalangium sp. TaxID=2028555 RepID=UPI002D6666C1|nr:hypothetical protein [Hyalangium sp.]HYI02999.1 hypothetical protein [Hyalangium sp.]